MAGSAIIEQDIPDDEVDLFESDLDQAPDPVSRHRQRAKMSKTKLDKKKTRAAKPSGTSSSEGEHFDLDVSSTEEST
jgi:hypothetical protein